MNIRVFRLNGNKSHEGGAEQSALLHAKVLSEFGHDAVLYSNFADSSNISKKIATPSNKLLRWIWGWVYFPLLATFKKADLLNPHSREDQIVLTLTKWLHRTPVVWKDPGDLVHHVRLERRSLSGRLNQKLLIAAIRKADAIYILNEENKKTLLERLKKLGVQIDSYKFTVIPSDILFDKYDLNVKPPKQTDKLVVGTLSRLDDHKGVQYLIEAMNRLDKSHDNLELWVVGDGPYRSELEKLAQGLDATFWGHQPDVSPYLNRFDIFVQPAEFEGWGRNVKEARYFGKAIIGSDTGGIAQQIEDGKTGLLFEPKNVDELTQKLDKLIQNKDLRATLGKNAHRSAISDGDFRNLVKEKILPLFESFFQKSQ